MKRNLCCVAIILSLLASAFSNMFSIEVKAEETNSFALNLYAQSATLMDAESGRILFEKKGDVMRSNASTTKIMTCILVLELEPDLEQVVEVSSYAAKQPRVHLGMREGEHYKVKDLLYSMMLESHNDSAAALAEYIGKYRLKSAMVESDALMESDSNKVSEQPIEQESVSAVSGIDSEEAVLRFANAMNQKAKEIGCGHTCFVTPNGLDAVYKNRKHGCSSNDLARIMSYCVTESPCRELFLEITGTSDYSFWEQGQKRQFSCRNHNALLSQREDAISGKTGFTNQAGYCYVGTIKSVGRVYTVALLGAGWPNNKNYKWKDCKTLLDYGTEQYEKITLEDFRDEICEEEEIQVTGGAGEKLFEIPLCKVSVDPLDFENGEKEILLKNGEQISVQRQMDDFECRLQAPVSVHQKVGTVSVYIDDTLWQQYALYTQDSVEAISERWCIQQIFCTFFCFSST